MRYLLSSRARLICALLATLLFVTIAASAKGGREFSGYFDVSGVHEQDELVQVTLHLKLFNRGTTDAKNVIVTLMESGPTTTLRGNFQPVKTWKSGQAIEMSQEFSVPKREFAEWMAAPGQPNLFILFQDSKGHSWQKGAQISRRPLLP